jgi:hypothetical protein
MVTNLKDRNGILIKEGDIVRDSQGLTGKVIFTNGAWRYDVYNGTYLKFNSSLLFKEGIGTSQLEVVSRSSRPSQASTQQESLMAA